MSIPQDYYQGHCLMREARTRRGETYLVEAELRSPVQGNHEWCSALLKQLLQSTDAIEFSQFVLQIVHVVPAYYLARADFVVLCRERVNTKGIAITKLVSHVGEICSNCIVILKEMPNGGEVINGGKVGQVLLGELSDERPVHALDEQGDAARSQRNKVAHRG